MPWGLSFGQTGSRYVTPKGAGAIIAALPKTVTAVGVFVDPTPALVREVLETTGVSLLQFHGNESAGDCEMPGCPYMKAVRVKVGVDLQQLADQYTTAEALLVDTYRKGVPGGTGEAFDWSLLPAKVKKPLVLAGGLRVENCCRRHTCRKTSRRGCERGRGK